MNKKIKNLILEELEMFLLLEQAQIPENLVSDVKAKKSDRTGQTLEGAVDDVIKLVFQIQVAAGMKGEDLDGIYGPKTHSAILATQGTYDP